MANNSVGLNSRNPFLIPELFHCFLECLVTSLPQRPGLTRDERITLATLARTCRAFSEPSLDCLWRCLNSLQPLVRCFSKVVDERRVKVPPSPPERLVIGRYSPRIQDLTLGSEILSLYFLQHAGILLPNLRVLRLKCPPISKFFFHPLAFLWPLFPSQIVSLEVQVNTMDDDDPNLLSFLHHYFPLLCPDLKSIKLKRPNTPNRRSIAGVSHVLSRAICANEEWEHVELCALVDYDILRHLGMSSTLKTLSLQLAFQMSRPDETCFGPQDTPFCNVIDLALVLGNSLDFVTCLLRPRDQAFKSFKVTLYTLAFPAEVYTLLTALASPQRIHSLQSLVIDHIPYFLARFAHPVREMPSHLTCETFRPLTSLVHLRKLVVYLDNWILIDDTEFAGLVRSWPLLEVLQMMWIQDERPAVSVTLHGLLSLLASCPKLRNIGLTLDARDVPSGTYPHADVCRPSITSPMTVCHSPLGHPEQVAKFLTKHLPSMRGVGQVVIWSSYASFPWPERWFEVHNHMVCPESMRKAPRSAGKFPMLKYLWSGCLGRSDDGGDVFVDVFPEEEDY